MWVYVHSPMYLLVFGIHLWCCVSQFALPPLWAHSPTWLMDRISGNVKACYCSHADLLSGWWELRWMLPSGSSLAPPLGFKPSSYQLWLWTHCLLAQWEALISVPKSGESLTPDATTNQLWPLSYLLRTTLVVLFHAIVTRKKRQGSADVDRNVSSTIF